MIQGALEQLAAGAEVDLTPFASLDLGELEARLR